jgi:hypothetical protein
MRILVLGQIYIRQFLLRRIVDPKIFITYSSKDDKVARTICTALENRGLACWISSRNVKPGQNYQEQIVKAIRAAKIMVLVFTTNANNSNEIKKELSLASQNNLIVIPVRIENVPPNEAFAYEFATRQWIDFFDDWENSITRLAELIAASLDDSSLAASAAAPSFRNAGQISFVRRWGPLWAIICILVLVVAAGAYKVATLTKQPASVVTTVPALSTTQLKSPPQVEAQVPLQAVVDKILDGVGSTGSAQFGGAPYCSYKVDLENSELNAVAAQGSIKSAALSLVMAESTVGSCAFAPLGRRSHTYSGGGTTDGSNISLFLNPAPENKPQASATFSGHVVNGRLVGTITVHRLDQRPILAWTVQISTQ